MYRRILLKLSGEALSGGKGFGLDAETTRAVAKQVKEAAETGTQIAIVIGGGNFWRGRSAEGIDRVKADQIGMLGTVMNCLYVSEIFQTEGMKTAVYTPYAIGLYTEIFNKDKAVRDLEEGKIVFFAGGTGHPFFSTDMGTALYAVQTECEMILMAKSVDGVYDSDPALNANAKKYDRLSYQELLSQNLKVIDLPAAAFCMENQMPAQLFALQAEQSILKAVKGEAIGTVLY
ncbi:MAG: UMP kinase [Lachnospiraceae bacterium]|jgi:uridylate kinase|nr:UMP kinase [Lachnospiraceae bacterium]